MARLARAAAAMMAAALLAVHDSAAATSMPEVTQHGADGRWCSYHQCTGAVINWAHGYGGLVRYCDAVGNGEPSAVGNVTLTLWAVDYEPQSVRVRIKDEAENIVHEQTVLADFVPERVTLPALSTAKYWVWLENPSAVNAPLNVGYDLLMTNTSSYAAAVAEVMNCVDFTRVRDNINLGADNSGTGDDADESDTGLIAGFVSALAVLLLLLAAVVFRARRRRLLAQNPAEFAKPQVAATGTQEEPRNLAP